MSENLSENDKNVVIETCNNIIQWLDNSNEASKEEYEDKQKELQEKIQPIISKIYGSEVPSDAPMHTDPNVSEVD